MEMQSVRSIMSHDSLLKYRGGGRFIPNTSCTETQFFFSAHRDVNKQKMAFVCLVRNHAQEVLAGSPHAPVWDVDCVEDFSTSGHPGLLSPHSSFHNYLTYVFKMSLNKTLRKPPFSFCGFHLILSFLRLTLLDHFTKRFTEIIFLRLLGYIMGVCAMHLLSVGTSWELCAVTSSNLEVGDGYICHFSLLERTGN